MAHVVTLPVKVNFEVERATWSLGRATAEEYFLGYSNDGNFVFKVSEPIQHAGVKDTVELRLLPRILASRLEDEVNVVEREYPHMRLHEQELRASRLIRKKLSSQRVEVLVCSRPAGGEGPGSLARKIDPWIVRDKFIRLRKRASDLVEFLNTCGVWKHWTGPRYSANGNWESTILLPESIWVDQERIKRALQSEPGEYLAEADFYPLTGRAEFPFFSYSPSFTFDAILTSITIDFLRGSKFHSCARKDCSVSFKVESKHRRMYCSWYCGHIESVRRNRQNRVSLNRRRRTS